MEAYGTNHNILAITAKQTPVTAVTAGFQENVIPIPREFPRESRRTVPLPFPCNTLMYVSQCMCSDHFICWRTV